MKKRMFIMAAACVFLLATNCAATAASIFGPNQYIRTTGPKNVYTATYSASPGPGLITILNGEENGDNRVTSATVTLNGANIFVPNDFKKAVYRLEKQVTLAAANTIVIILASKPGSYLTFTQSQDAPSLTAAADPAEILAGQTAALTWSSTLADSISIDQGLGNIELSGTLSVSPQATTVYTFTASGAGGTSTFPVTVTVIPPPTASITASPETIVIGNACELSWTSENADRVEIDNDIGAVPLSGSLSVFPTETTTYTIKATGPGGSATDNIAITVITLPIITMTTEPQAINAGESFVLTWSVSYADSVIGEQTTSAGTNSEEIPLSGTNTLSPSRTTTYTITATGPGGSASKCQTVVVNVPPPTVAIAATPSSISSGSPATLEWHSDNADECAITPGIGQVSTSGTTEISPAQTVTYTITATGPGGVATAETVVSVNALPPTVFFSANPVDINFGESSILSWQVFMADSCEISPDIGPVDLTGTTSVSSSGTTTYTLTATGPGGTTIKTATIELPDVDLEPVHMDASNCITNGQTLAISGSVDVDIRNNGTRIVNNSFMTVLFEDRDNNSQFNAGTDNVLGANIVSAGLEPGASVKDEIPVNGFISFADNRIFAFVDSGDSIREGNETNNTTHTMADCEYHPPVGSFTPAVEWQWTGSPIKPTSNQVADTPAVGQLTDDNGDGVINSNDMPDIVFVSYVGGACTTNGTLRALSGDGGRELFSITNYETMGVCSPALGDIDNDGLVEIIVMQEYVSTATYQAKIIAFENDGTFKWISDQYAFSDELGHSISLSDIDADGHVEIICGRVVLNCDGSLKWHGTGNNGQGNSIAADVDLDGFQEVIAGNTCYETNGSIAWQNTSVQDGYVATGNFDDDRFPEIVLVANGRVYLLEHNGAIKWTSAPFVGGGLGGAPCVADYDNDGQPEIGVSAKDNYTVFETNGTTKWDSAIIDPSSNRTASSVFDFEGDGSAEVVCRDEHYLRIFSGLNGIELFRFPVNSRTRAEYPIIVDLDNDNNAEVVTVADTYLGGSKRGVIVLGDLNDTWVNTRKIWNQHTYHITNVNDVAASARISCKYPTGTREISTAIARRGADAAKTTTICDVRI